MNISSTSPQPVAAAGASGGNAIALNVLRKELDMQKEMMAQLLAGLGIGQNVDTVA